jgi:hypothetical protein
MLGCLGIELHIFFNLFSVELSLSHGLNFFFFQFQPTTLDLLEMKLCNFFISI